MVRYLKNKYGLSDKGAKDLFKAIIACTLTDISFMVPVGLLYMVIKGLVGKYLGGDGKLYNVGVYIGVSVVILGIIFALQKFQYDATFLASYEESANKRIGIAEKLRKLPLSFFSKKDLADLTTTIMGDCSALETAFSHYIPQLYGSIISVIFVGIGLLTFDWKLACTLLWVVPVAFIITIAGKNQQNKVNKKNNDLKIDCADNIQECIDNIREIKANNQGERYLTSLISKVKKLERLSIVSELNTAIYVVSSQMLLKVGIATMTLMGSYLISKNEVDFLTFLMFLIAASRVFDPLGSALINLAAIFSTEIKIDRMKEIENHELARGNKNVIIDNYDIKFEHVRFAYDDSETVLQDVSFIAKQGEVTALVGPSGGGKSTITKLAAKFWDITEGKISIGGKDINSIESEELLKNVSIVFQDVLLFNNSIMENIRLGRKGATDEEVKRVAKLACCDEFISKLPQGYDTVIGENGSTLSGGERQRLSIARALLKDAPIVFLDEATASLDVENESKVQEAISRLVKNKTVLVIAHRMRTIFGADKIVVLENGRVVEEGNHDSLIKKKGIYNRLCTLQMQAAEWTI